MMHFLVHVIYTCMHVIVSIHTVLVEFLNEPFLAALREINFSSIFPMHESRNLMT